MPRAGLEPARRITNGGFKSLARHFCLFNYFVFNQFLKSPSGCGRFVTQQYRLIEAEEKAEYL